MQSDAKDIGDLDRDILEWNVPEEVLAVLLKDRSTGAIPSGRRTTMLRVMNVELKEGY